MTAANPLVSVIITTYNRPDYLQEAIASVAAQTHSNLEILVVDDGSKDNYAEPMCEPYANCSYHYKENGGLSSARNYGIQLAKGEFVAILDDDDSWRPDKLKLQLEAFKMHPEVSMVHCAAAVMTQDGQRTGKHIGASAQKAHKRSGNVFWNALGVWVVKSPTPLIRASTLKAPLLFDTSIKVGEDIDFYQRYFYKYKVHYIADSLANYREYNNATRLSLQRAKYIGIGFKMIQNFKAMGVRSPWLRYKIARRLLQMEGANWKLAHANKPLRYPKMLGYLAPVYCLKTYFRAE